MPQGLCIDVLRNYRPCAMSTNSVLMIDKDNQYLSHMSHILMLAPEILALNTVCYDMI